MKKTTTILAAVALLIVGATTTSCKKNYTCQCSKTYTTGSGSSTTNYAVYTYDDTHVHAESRCDANNATSSDLGGNYTINCKIE